MKRSRISWKWTLAACAVAAMAVASIGVAAPSRDSERGEQPKRGQAHLRALAAELDVSTAELRSALRDAREELGRPPRPERGERPSREELDQRCTEHTDALAEALGKDGDEVRAAIKKVAGIDSDRCVPPLGPRGGPGCGGPHGPGGGPPPEGMEGRFMR